MPSQDNENAMDGLLRRSLARHSTAAGDCPDAELLPHISTNRSAPTKPPDTSFISPPARAAANNSQRWRASARNRSCNPISRLNRLSRVRGQSQAIALEAARTHAQAKPATSSARSETKFPERKSPDARWLDLRWLIPVAAMLVLGTFMFMRFASHDTTVGLSNQVAVSKPATPPQEQTVPELEKKASDVGTLKKTAPKNKPSPESTTSRLRSSAKPAAKPEAPQQIPNLREREETKARRPVARPQQASAPRSRRPTKTEKAPV